MGIQGLLPLICPKGTPHVIWHDGIPKDVDPNTLIDLRGKVVAVDAAAILFPISTHKSAYLAEYITPDEPATYMCETLEIRLIKPLLQAGVSTIILVFDGLRQFEPKQLTRHARRKNKRDALEELRTIRKVVKGEEENKKYVRVYVSYSRKQLLFQRIWWRQ